MKLNRYTAIAVSAAALIGTLGMAAPASAATLGSSCPLASSGSNRMVYSYFQPVRHQTDMTAFYNWLLSQAKLAAVAKAPATQVFVVKAPVAQAPVAKAPVAQAPVAPAAEPTVTDDTLVADAPVAQAPVAQAPKAEAPVAQAPVQQAPVQKAPAQQAPATQTQTSNAAGMTAEEQQMLTLINGARAQAGLAPLQADAKLTQLARMKSQDMVNRNYFDHTSPTYGSPFQMMQTYGVTYQTAGENIAGNPSVTGAFQAWMNSPGHRANILNGQYNTTGIGIVHGGQYGIMFTQEFVGR